MLVTHKCENCDSVLMTGDICVCPVNSCENCDSVSPIDCNSKCRHAHFSSHDFPQGPATQSVVQPLRMVLGTRAGPHAMGGSATLRMRLFSCNSEYAHLNGGPRSLVAGARWRRRKSERQKRRQNRGPRLSARLRRARSRPPRNRKRTAQRASTPKSRRTTRPTTAQRMRTQCTSTLWLGTAGGAPSSSWAGARPSWGRRRHVCHQPEN